MITHSERHKLNGHPNHIQNQSISGGIVAVYIVAPLISIDCFQIGNEKKGQEQKKNKTKPKNGFQMGRSAVYCVLPNLRTHFNRVSLSLSLSGFNAHITSNR